MKNRSIPMLLALACALATPGFAQQPPDSSAPPSPPAQAPAPVERRIPPDDPHHDRRREIFHRGGFAGGPGDFGGMGLRLGPPGMWWKNQTIVERLALTPEQVKKMDDIFQQSRLQLVDLKANLERQNLLLEPLLSANPVDTARAAVQIDKVAEARAELEKASARMLLSIRGVLTPDQWTKLRPQGHFGHEGGGPPQP